MQNRDDSQCDGVESAGDDDTFVNSDVIQRGTCVCAFAIDFSGTPEVTPVRVTVTSPLAVVQSFNYSPQSKLYVK